MTLHELLNTIGEEDVQIQICTEDCWDEFDTFKVSSKFLIPFYNLKVLELEAIDTDVFRVDLNLSELDTIDK